MDRQTAERQSQPATHDTVIRELERIALGPDSNANTHDQVTALKVLVNEPKKKEEGSFTLFVVTEEAAKEFDGLDAEEAHALMHKGKVGDELGVHPR
jgi:hypothetical protein